MLGYDWFGMTPAEHNRRKAEAVVKLRTALDDFQSLASHEGFKLVVILHPHYHELRAMRYNFDADNLKSYMQNGAIPFVDLLQYFAQTVPLEEEFLKSLFWEKDFHHNADGYRKFAEGIEAHLRKHDLIPDALDS